MNDLRISGEPNFWQSNLPYLLEHLKATLEGLTSREAAKRLKSCGPNVFHPQRKNTIWVQFLSKFNNL